jgi:hypothetical protein
MIYLLLLFCLINLGLTLHLFNAKKKNKKQINNLKFQAQNTKNELQALQHITNLRNEELKSNLQNTKNELQALQHITNLRNEELKTNLQNTQNELKATNLQNEELKTNLQNTKNELQALQNITNLQNEVYVQSLRNKILEDQKNGYKTIILTETSDRLWVKLDMYFEIIKTIKKNIEKCNIVFYINPKISQQFKSFFKDIFNNSFVIFSKNEKTDINNEKSFLQSFNPYLIFAQGETSNKTLFPKQFCPSIEVTSNPYQKYLMLDKNHIYYVKALSGSIERISNLEVEADKLHLIQTKLKPLLLQKQYNLVSTKHKEVYEKHIAQFAEFRKKYERIIIFSFLNFNNCIKDGMAFFRDFLSKLPKNYLVIITFHPQYFISREFLDIAGHNTDFDINLHYEIKGEKGDYKPMEILKSEFPNFITEFDLEIKKIHKTPELPSLTNFIIQYCDGVICSHSSKVSFNAMESDKPVFAYFKNGEDFCFKLLGLEAKDVATYDFAKQTPTELYNKIFHFMFTRMLHKHLFGADKDFQKFYDFIDYENEKIAQNIGDPRMFEFYGRENQSIEEVIEIIEKA